MSNRLRQLSLCAVALCLMRTPTFAQQFATMVSEAPVYLYPDVYREPLLVAGKDSTADILATEGVWYRISFEDSRGWKRVGYVQAKFVRVTDRKQAGQRKESTATISAPAATAGKPAPVVPRAPTTAARSAAASKGERIVLNAVIVDRKTSETSYTYISPARATSTTSSTTNCGGTATTFIPQITNIDINCNGSASTNTTIQPSAQYGYDVTGATFTLRLPDGRHVIVNCDDKYALKFDYINRRSCRMPLVDNISVEFDGDKAKLIWQVSIDGKKTESETYRMLAVLN